MFPGMSIAPICISLATIVGPAHSGDLDSVRVSELATRVEKILGRDFVMVPPVATATPAEVELALRIDAKARAIAAGASEEDADRAVVEGSIAIGLQAARLTALYLPSSKRIIVQPAVLDALVERGVVPASERPRVIELLIVHELVHALQDQEVGLIGFLAPTESDPVRRTERMYARRAVAEGQAMLVQGLVGESLVQESPAWSAAVATTERIAPGALQPDGDRDRYRESVVYRGGEAWMRDRHRSGGAAAIWAAFHEPPDDLATFASKSSAFDPAYSTRLAKALEGESASFGPAWRARATSASPSVGLASQLASLPKEQREQIIASVRGLVAVVGGTAAGARLLVAVVVARDELSAPALDRDLFAMQTTALKAMGSKSPEQMETDTDGIHAIGRRENVELAGSELRVAMLHGRSGLVTIQITALNSDHDFASLRDIAARFVRAVEAVKTSEAAVPPKTE